MNMTFLLPVRNWMMNVMRPRIGYIARLLNQIFARTVKALPLLPVISILPPWENLLYGDMAGVLPEKIVLGTISCGNISDSSYCKKIGFTATKSGCSALDIL